MGCGISKEDKEGAARNDEIEVSSGDVIDAASRLVANMLDVLNRLN